ncbi:hypothetical protein LTR48_008645, partial [Friedmanniomyces endolithicus]
MPVRARMTRLTVVTDASRARAMLAFSGRCVASAIVAMVGTPRKLLRVKVESRVVRLGRSLAVLARLGFMEGIFSISMTRGAARGRFPAHAIENGWLDQRANA